MAEPAASGDAPAAAYRCSRAGPAAVDQSPARRAAPPRSAAWPERSGIPQRSTSNSADTPPRCGRSTSCAARHNRRSKAECERRQLTRARDLIGSPNTIGRRSLPCTATADAPASSIRHQIRCVEPVRPAGPHLDSHQDPHLTRHRRTALAAYSSSHQAAAGVVLTILGAGHPC